MASDQSPRDIFRVAASIQKEARARGFTDAITPNDGASSTDATPQDLPEAAALMGQPSATAFITWAHRHPDMTDLEAEEWERQVVEFTTVLRQQGVDADVDMFHLDDVDVDWTRFGPEQIKAKSFVFILVSRAWTERWEGRNRPTEGAGAAVEADALKGRFQKQQAEFQRSVKIVILPGQSDDDTPAELNRLVKYFVDPSDPDTFDPLLRALTSQPKYPMPPLGDVPVLHPRAVAGLPRARRGTNTDYSRLLKELRQLNSELAKAEKGGEDRTQGETRAHLLQRRAVVQGMLDAVSYSND